MNEWERLNHQHQVDKSWQALVDRLKQAWGSSFEHKAYYAKRVLEAGGAAHLQKLAGLPVSAMVQIAEAYSRVGEGQGQMSVQEVHLAAEYLADPKSLYHQKGDDAELNAGAKGLVEDLFKAAAGGEVPADQSEQPGRSASSPPPAEGEERPPAAQEAEKLMRSPAYWNTGHPESQSVRAQVQQLMSEAYPEPSPARGEGGDAHA
jgi:hypothetical protein